MGGVKSQHWLARLFHHLSASQIKLSPSTPVVDVDSYPTAFRAWLVYKNLVNVILINDGLNYLLLGVKCFHLPHTLSWLVLLQYALGVFLALFNWWAKVDAHRCIGEFSWYWGDFFFRKEMTLTFDGIFELFPHPMYTVGYSLYYGYSLICTILHDALRLPHRPLHATDLPLCRRRAPHRTPLWLPRTVALVLVQLQWKIVCTTPRRGYSLRKS